MSSRYKDEGDLIFPNAKGAPLDGQNLAVREFKPTLRRAGLPSIRFQDLRHTFGTLLLERRVPVTVVSKMLGHASAKNVAPARKGPGNRAFAFPSWAPREHVLASRRMLETILDQVRDRQAGELRSA